MSGAAAAALPTAVIALACDEDRSGWPVKKPDGCTSEWWQYFSVYTLLSWLGIAVCDLCRAEVPRGAASSTAGMKQHIETHHPEYYLDGVLRKLEKKPRGMSKYLITNPGFCDSFIKWVVMTQQPLSVAESPYFQRMLTTLSPTIKLSRAALAESTITSTTTTATTGSGSTTTAASGSTSTSITTAAATGADNAAAGNATTPASAADKRAALIVAAASLTEGTHAAGWSNGGTGRGAGVPKVYSARGGRGTRGRGRGRGANAGASTPGRGRGSGASSSVVTTAESSTTSTTTMHSNGKTKRKTQGKLAFASLDDSAASSSDESVSSDASNVSIAVTRSRKRSKQQVVLDVDDTSELDDEEQLMDQSNSTV